MKKLALLFCFWLAACASTPQQTTTCSDQQKAMDTATRALMILNGYYFEGGC